MSASTKHVLNVDPDLTREIEESINKVFQTATNVAGVLVEAYKSDSWSSVAETLQEYHFSDEQSAAFQFDTANVIRLYDGSETLEESIRDFLLNKSNEDPDYLNPELS